MYTAKLTFLQCSRSSAALPIIFAIIPLSRSVFKINIVAFATCLLFIFPLPLFLFTTLSLDFPLSRLPCSPEFFHVVRSSLRVEIISSNICVFHWYTRSCVSLSSWLETRDDEQLERRGFASRYAFTLKKASYYRCRYRETRCIE